MVRGTVDKYLCRLSKHLPKVKSTCKVDFCTYVVVRVSAIDYACEYNSYNESALTLWSDLQEPVVPSIQLSLTYQLLGEQIILSGA